MTTSEMIRKLCCEMDISLSELARRIGQSPQNFSKKLKRESLFCGKVMFMRKFGVSIHVSAAYCIGLRSLGILDDLTIPDHLGHLMDTKKEQGPYYVAEKISSLYTKLKNIRTHAFYLDLPDVGTVTKLKTWLRVNDQNKPAWYAADF